MTAVEQERVVMRSGGFSVYRFGTVSSTNQMLKVRGRQKNLPEGTVFWAQAQSAGRGRLGRSYFSPGQTGLYMSFLLRQPLPEQPAAITTAAAVAVCQSLEAMAGEGFAIKWVNDVYRHGKKVCGILTERVDYGKQGCFVVVGIGVNLYPPKEGFPPELRDKAGAVFSPEERDACAEAQSPAETAPVSQERNVCPKNKSDAIYFQREQNVFPKAQSDPERICSLLTRDDMAERLLWDILERFWRLRGDLEGMGHMEEYRRRSLLTGKWVSYDDGGGMFCRGRVKGVGDAGELMLEDPQKGEIRLRAGEVQLVFR